MSVVHIPPTHARRWHVGPLLVTVLVLAAALVALGTWTLVDRQESSSTTGLASPKVVAMLRNRIAALNSGDDKAIAAFYARDAVLEERDVTPAVVTSGSQQIGERIGSIVRLFGMQLEPTGPMVRLGGTVAEATSVPGNPDEGFILAYRLDAQGKIAHQWVLPAA